MITLTDAQAVAFAKEEIIRESGRWFLPEVEDILDLLRASGTYTKEEEPKPCT